MARPTFETITETATQIRDSWSSRDKVSFHYFNMNGLYAQEKALNRRIDILVHAGFLPSGWILAYGGFDDYFWKQMQKLATQKRVSVTEYRIWRNSYQERINANRTRIEAAEDAFIAGTSYEDFSAIRRAA